MESEIAEAYRRFEIPGTARIVEGNGGLPKLRITSAEAVGEMYLHGAHVTSWKPAGGEEVLFLSSQSRWEHGHAIRGGVPICFPWFGGKADDPTAPAHGFVRTKTWQLESIAQVGHAVTVSMLTESDEGTKRWWPAEFRLVHRVTFGQELSLELVVSNTGRTSLRFEEALHAYHRVGNISNTRLRGLDAVHYYDKTDSNRKKMQQGEVVIVSETDRVYLDTADAIELEDPVLRRRTRVLKENSRTTVV
jgi:glucose-6-phosphate 1-epimerase